MTASAHLFWVVVADAWLDQETHDWRIICVCLSLQDAIDVKRVLETQRDSFEAAKAAIDDELTARLREFKQTVTIAPADDEKREAWFAFSGPLYESAKTKRTTAAAEIDMLDRRYELHDHFDVTYKIAESSDDPRLVFQVASCP